MIVAGSGVSEIVADDARASLDKEINELLAEGRLAAGKKTLEKLKWTPATLKAARIFEETIDLAPLKSFGVTTDPSDAKRNIKWTGPIIYSDVLSDPLSYSSSASGYGIIGIIALGTLQLPEIGDSGSKEIKSGSVAYFRDSDPVVYRSCGGGRGILFYISI